jgi:menaquinone-dependent protoporphyrinogen oxidase
MNNKSILLAYASRYGSTQEVAEAIATVLRAAALEVDIKPIQEVTTLDAYTLVVLGAALYNTRWHTDAHQFLSQHRDILRQRPVAIFALGPLNASEVAMQNSRRQLARELQKYPWLKPVALEMFVGKLDPSKLSFFERLGAKASDNRNWEAIRAWAETLPSKLQPVVNLAPAG